MFNRKLKEEIARLELELGREKQAKQALRNRVGEGREVIREFVAASIPTNALKEKAQSWLDRSSGV